MLVKYNINNNIVNNNDANATTGTIKASHNNNDSVFKIIYLLNGNILIQPYSYPNKYLFFETNGRIDISKDESIDDIITIASYQFVLEGAINAATTTATTPASTHAYHIYTVLNRDISINSGAGIEINIISIDSPASTWYFHLINNLD